MHGGSGDDFMIGDATGPIGDSTGDDVINGDAGNDTVLGDGTGYFGVVAGDDVISGDDGDDSIDGQGGHDVLQGAQAWTRLRAAMAATRSIFQNLSDGVDTISDFVTGLGGDVLDIAHLLVGFVAGKSNLADFVNATLPAATPP
jgi:Ca2+-binding RTX toxin-like protein